MRRIGRYILNGLTVLSLVLCVATVALWVRSYSVADCFERYDSEFATSDGYPVFVDDDWTLESTRGGVAYSHALSNRYFREGRGAFQQQTRTRTPAHEFALPRSRRGTQRLPAPPGRQYRFAGIVVGRQIPNYMLVPDQSPIVVIGATINAVRIPYWLPTLLLALLPIARVILIVRSRQAAARQSGLCSKCGYDLRATPDRCPECGSIPAKVKA